MSGLQFALTTLVVIDYNEAISYFVDILGFTLRQDTIVDEGKRWVIVSPSKTGAGILLAKAVNEDQIYSVGNQTGGRVSFFLNTDDFERDYHNWMAKGVRFLQTPREESYGKVVVFEDLYGNRWDLIQPKESVS